MEDDKNWGRTPVITAHMKARMKASREYAKMVSNDDETPTQRANRARDFECGAMWANSHPAWVNVEERLPEENTAPLVRMDLTEKFDEETILYDVVVFDGNGFHTPYKVTHWMEIIPPRKEE